MSASTAEIFGYLLVGVLAALRILVTLRRGWKLESPVTAIRYLIGFVFMLIGAALVAESARWVPLAPDFVAEDYWLVDLLGGCFVGAGFGLWTSWYRSVAVGLLALLGLVYPSLVYEVGTGARTPFQGGGGRYIMYIFPLLLAAAVGWSCFRDERD